MELITYLIILFVSGLLVGGLARLALPGKDPMSIWGTAALGIAGSLIAGLLVYVVTGGRGWGGITISIVCAAVILYFIRRSRGGGLFSPGRTAPASRRGTWPR
jgi:uncharacterized membrane protein YeaQ/YmgE (transglycosylase-associated protein family)